jgi:hypothetical protein
VAESKLAVHRPSRPPEDEARRWVAPARLHARAQLGNRPHGLGIIRALPDQHTDRDGRAMVQPTVAMHEETTVRIERGGEIVAPAGSCGGSGFLDSGIS